MSLDYIENMFLLLVMIIAASSVLGIAAWVCDWWESREDRDEW